MCRTDRVLLKRSVKSTRLIYINTVYPSISASVLHRRLCHEPVLLTITENRLPMEVETGFRSYLHRTPPSPWGEGDARGTAIWRATIPGAILLTPSNLLPADPTHIDPVWLSPPNSAENRHVSPHYGVHCASPLGFRGSRKLASESGSGSTSWT